MQERRVTKGSLIGQSRKAEVFAWGDDQAVKLFRNSVDASRGKQEAWNTQRVRETGLPVPDVKGIVEVDGARGIVYERIEGPTMRRRVRSRPWTLVQCAHLLAELHVAVHSCTIPELPSQRRQMEQGIQAAAISANLKETALEALDRLPDDNVLCHGDLHLDNVLMSPRGPYIIDWYRAMRGNPVADVAKTLLLLRLGPVRCSWFGRLPANAARALFRHVYLRRYMQLRPIPPQQIAAWQLPIASELLSREHHKGNAQLLAIAEASVPR